MLKTEITYYEDEIYETDFEINQCKNYKGLMEKYLKEGTWTFLPKNKSQKLIENPPYFDIDAINDNWPYSYYGELTQFLNKREEKYKMYKYVAPNKCQKAGQGDKQYPGSNTNEIIVYDYNGKEEKFRLKSDQFGFSVGRTKKDFASHPYGCLWNSVKDNKDNKDKTEEEKERVYGVIAECIYHTRTLGGGFLWQIDAGTQNGIYEYNRSRGQSYIEDRVDLTLLEIKHLFEWIELGMPKEGAQEKDVVDLFHKIKGNGRDDGLYSKIEDKKQKEKIAYIEWLRHFGTFKNFIQFFCFDDFVDSKYKTWMPLDIMKSKLEWNDESESLRWEKVVFLEDPTEYKLEGKDCYKKISNKKLSTEELKQMLINVSSLTLARSYRMQKVIDDISN